MDDFNGSTQHGFQNYTEKDFVTGQIREISRKLVKETNLWKHPPKDWPEEELGKWKCPTASPKDNLDLMKMKLKYLRAKLPQSELSNTEKQKLQYYDKGNMKAVNEIIHSVHSIYALENVENFLSTVKGEVPQVQQNLEMIRILHKKLARILEETCAKVSSSLSESANLTKARKRSCPTSFSQKMTPAKQKPDPVPIAPKPSLTANLISSLQSTSTNPIQKQHHATQCIGFASQHENTLKTMSSSSSDVTQSSDIIFLCSLPQPVCHNHDYTPAESNSFLSVSNANNLGSTPPVYSLQHQSSTFNPILPESPELLNENSKTEPDRAHHDPCHIPDFAQYESRIQHGSCQEAIRSCSVDSGITSDGIPSPETETVASEGSDDDHGDIKFYEGNLEGLDEILENIETGDCSKVSDILSLFLG